MSLSDPSYREQWSYTSMAPSQRETNLDSTAPDALFDLQCEYPISSSTTHKPHYPCTGGPHSL